MKLEVETIGDNQTNLIKLIDVRDIALTKMLLTRNIVSYHIELWTLEEITITRDSFRKITVALKALEALKAEKGR